MKIICLTTADNGNCSAVSSESPLSEIVVKPETALLVNNKPLYIPHFTNDLRALPCLAIRISRLGRNIEQRFASRYYDAIATSMSFRAYDRLQQALQNKLQQSQWDAFDNSFAISKWAEIQNTDGGQSYNIVKNDTVLTANAEALTTPEKAIEIVSRYFKLCTGDIIAINMTDRYIPLSINDIVQITTASQKQNILLYTTIK